MFKKLKTLFIPGHLLSLTIPFCMPLYIYKQVNNYIIYILNNCVIIFHKANMESRIYKEDGDNETAQLTFVILGMIYAIISVYSTIRLASTCNRK